MSVASRAILSNFLEKQWTQKQPTIPFGVVACTLSDNLSQNSCIPVVILCWAITQFIPHLWYISHKALVTDDTMFSSVESSEGKATPRGAKFHFLRAFSSVAYEIHPRNSPSPLPLTQVPFSLLQAAVWSSFNPNNVLTQDQEPMKFFPLCSLLHQDWKCCGYVPAAAGT